MIQLDLTSAFGEAPVFFKPETESTIIDAKNLSAQGLPSGTAVVAGYQVAGRGRFVDRKWQAEPGQSLLLTLFIKYEEVLGPLCLVPLKLGLGLAVTLEKECGLEPAIKWPNDVFLRDRKVAGLLAEVRDGWVFLSLGLNCLQKSFPREIRHKATSLRIESGFKREPRTLLPPLLAEIKARLFDPGDWKSELEKRLYLKDSVISFRFGLEEGEKVFRGTLLGVRDDGQLEILDSENGEVRLFAGGEIVIEPKKGLFR